METERIRNGMREVRCERGKWYPITIIMSHGRNRPAIWRLTNAGNLGIPEPKGNDYRGLA